MNEPKEERPLSNDPPFEAGGLPPLIPPPPPIADMAEVPPPVPAARWRWWIHLILLLSYVLLLGVAGWGAKPKADEALLPETTRGLLVLSFSELGFFGFIFLLACLISRARPHQLLLRWNEGFRPVSRGFLYSIALRAVISVAMLIVVFSFGLFKGGGKETLEKLRPKTEAVINSEALTKDPVYFLLTLTLISFVVAGFREELWRSGVMAALKVLLPKSFDGIKGQLLLSALAAVVFGLGHLPQGIGGALATGALGFGLGLIMLRHQSIWEAVLAHGFFDATTFAMLYFIAKYQPDLLKALS